MQRLWRNYSTTWVSRLDLLHMQWFKEASDVLRPPPDDEPKNKGDLQRRRVTFQRKENIDNVEVVLEDVRRELLQDAFLQQRSEYRTKLAAWEKVNVKFRSRFNKTAQLEMGKMMLEGKLTGSWTLPQFCSQYMQELWLQRPRKPPYPYLMPREKMQALIVEGAKVTKRRANH